LESEQLQFHKEVRRGYLYLADKYPARIHVLDASLTEEEVFAAGLAALESHLLLKPHG
jgi:dTMP kinase